MWLLAIWGDICITVIGTSSRACAVFVRTLGRDTYCTHRQGPLTAALRLIQGRNSSIIGTDTDKENPHIGRRVTSRMKSPD
ncbi:hypothetical protein V8C26DRAFT_388189 [Trichoderma gracile]